MKERPIILSAEMVRAILAGRKTQTRRVITERYQQCLSPEDEPEAFLEFCPYGQPGDRLWVRETWGWFSKQFEWGDCRGVSYKADNAFAPKYQTFRPSIHMPRWASRITLEIVSVRVERVQDISEEDAKAEGVIPLEPRTGLYRCEFERVWDSINAKRGCGWNSNPWVWAIMFKRVQP